MNIEDIKVGEWYNVPFKVKEIKSGDIHIINGGIKAVCQPSELSVIGEASMPQYVRVDTSNDIDLRTPKGSPLKLSDNDLLFGKDEIKEFTEWLRQKAESTPKYDPCRLFREGDKVRPVKRYGRMPDDEAPVNVICEVVENERKNGTVTIRYRKNNISRRFTVTALYLELVAPIEELEPYRLDNDFFGWTVLGKDGLIVVRFHYDGHPHPKEAAEAECKRLNEEHRKEK